MLTMVADVNESVKFLDTSVLSQGWVCCFYDWCYIWCPSDRRKVKENNVINFKDIFCVLGELSLAVRNDNLVLTSCSYFTLCDKLTGKKLFHFLIILLFWIIFVVIAVYLFLQKLLLFIARFQNIQKDISADIFQTFLLLDNLGWNVFFRSCICL